eukprot:TRINITY_DN6466_c0_g1_i1.p1 TRINITY_DN6466_c0_g1~~TRINITY_DN6466_c0_g1_i1.p1  ORF type:complete len:298 (+),score=27.79 TRINITY_DN6466_c0_g1_i1:77-895(+)
MTGTASLPCDVKKGPSAVPIPGARKVVMNEFRASYTNEHRAMEMISVFAIFAMTALHMRNLHSVISSSNILVVIFAFFCSLLMADFVSGFVHWFADSWGTVEWPIIGRALIRSFREHHVDPSEICNHDFFETNGDSCTLAIPFQLGIFWVNWNSGTSTALFWYTFGVFLVFISVITNEFHKWAHSVDPPAIAKVLMKCGLILKNRDHYVHHRRPFDTYYCITNGWLNPFLSTIRFWRVLEWLVTKTTGAVPRSDDYYYARKYLNIADDFKWS